MIVYLEGLLRGKTPQSLVVFTGGIGYEVLVPLSTFYALPDAGEQVNLHIHTHVREDALVLFGFHTTLEKEIFQMLIAVTGIGPKLAINILSGIGPQELLQAMARGDAARLQAIPGVGRKTSERIALELKDRAAKVIGHTEVPLSQPRSGIDPSVMEDALSALLNLGYSSKASGAALERASFGTKIVTLEGLIREALRILA